MKRGSCLDEATKKRRKTGEAVPATSAPAPSGPPTALSSPPGSSSSKRRLSKKERKALKKQGQKKQGRPAAATAGGGNGGASARPKQTKASVLATSDGRTASSYPCSSSAESAASSTASEGKEAAATSATSTAAAASTAPPPTAATPAALPAAVEAVLEALKDRTAGTLSDRLNPTHSKFDGALKGAYKQFSKRHRALIVARDREVQAGFDAAVDAQCPDSHPFPVNADDHCETGPDAYGDVATLLHLLAGRLGKTPATLSIYDPYFCAGGVKRHLASEGFTSVYNKCEDFYAVVEAGEVPPHDVVVTNPPYSGEHVDKLLRFCRTNGKPFLLLMPNYFCAKPYYTTALGGGEAADSMLYLCPKKRYNYWTPKGLRNSEKVQGQHKGAGGAFRTSPFVSFWYLDLAPVVPTKALSKWWRQPGDVHRKPGLVLCRKAALPSGVKPAGIR